MKSMRSVMMGAAVVLCLTPMARADDMDSFTIFNDPDDKERVVSHVSNWQLSLGVGPSFIPNYTVTIPDYFGFSKPTQKKIGHAYNFEGSLTHPVNDWLRVGVLGGLDTGHQASLNDHEAFGFNFTDIHVELDETIHILKVVPMVQAGRWSQWQGWPVRPYAMAGLGAYQVNERRSIYLSDSYGSASIELSASTNRYMGGLVGGGLSLGVGQGTIGLELRYERLFSPGQTLQMITPMLQCGYEF